MRINLITAIYNGAGLQRDVELLRPVLASLGHDVACFCGRTTKTVRTAEVNLFLEIVNPRLFRCAREQWLIPNPEWFRTRWAQYFPKFELVLCKTKDAFEVFSSIPELAGRVAMLGFISKDIYDPNVIRKRRFIHVAGKSSMKSTASVLEAWRRGLSYPLTVVCQSQKVQRIANVTWHSRLDEAELKEQMNAHQFHLCPSEYEGWGHYLHEAMSSKAVVITTAAPPMCEFGAPSELMVPIERWWHHHLAKCARVTPHALIEAVEACVGLDATAVEHFGTVARERFLANLTAFQSRVKSVFSSGEAND